MCGSDLGVNGALLGSIPELVPVPVPVPELVPVPMNDNGYLCLISFILPLILFFFVFVFAFVLSDSVLFVVSVSECIKDLDFCDGNKEGNNDDRCVDVSVSTGNTGTLAPSSPYNISRKMVKKSEF